MVNMCFSREETQRGNRVDEVTYGFQRSVHIDDARFLYRTLLSIEFQFAATRVYRGKKNAAVDVTRDSHWSTWLQIS